MVRDPKEQNSPDVLLSRAYELESEEDTKALYEDWAETYDQTMLGGLGYLTPSRTAALLAEFLTDKNASILDIGAGTGLAGQELFERGFKNLVALDYSAEMLRVAGERKIYATLIEADLNGKLNLTDNQFDAMICTGTFTHAHVGANCFDELWRVLKPHGLFACTVHKYIIVKNGFADKLEAFKERAMINILHWQADIYFDTSDKPDGIYMVWQKALT